MNRPLRAILAGLLTAMAVPARSQSPALPDFSGTWRLDNTKTAMTGGPVRIGAPGTSSPAVGITEPVKIKHVSPIYPIDALRQRIEGVVIIDAILDVDGGVVSARVVRSVPDLDKAALDAVSQWKFTPAKLNGVPVSAVMTVTVNFSMGLGSTPRGSAPMPAIPPSPPPPMPPSAAPGSRGGGRAGGFGANALGDGPGLFPANQEIAITQSADTLVLSRALGETKETLTYRLDGVPTRNRQFGQGGGAAGEYVSVTRWVGETLVSEITGPDGVSEKRTETRTLDGDQLILDIVKTVAGVTPWKTRQVFLKVSK